MFKDPSRVRYPEITHPLSSGYSKELCYVIQKPRLLIIIVKLWDTPTYMDLVGIEVEGGGKAIGAGRVTGCIVDSGEGDIY